MEEATEGYARESVQMDNISNIKYHTTNPVWIAGRAFSGALDEVVSSCQM